MRSRPRRDPDEEILTHPPGDSSGDEPDGDGEEHVDDEGVEADEHFGRGVGRPPGPAEFYRFRPPTAPCALCGKASEGRDLMVVCPMHSKDPHEPTADACRLPQHPPLPGRPDLGVLACVVLAGYPSRCEVEWCHKRLWCFRDYYSYTPPAWALLPSAGLHRGLRPAPRSRFDQVYAMPGVRTSETRPGCVNRGTEPGSPGSP